MASIEVDGTTKRTVSFAARMAEVSEGEIIRRLVNASALARVDPEPVQEGIEIYADYEGHRVQARYFAPARVEIVDGPLAGQSFKTPTGAARAVVRLYNPSVTTTGTAGASGKSRTPPAAGCGSSPFGRGRKGAEHWRPD